MHHELLVKRIVIAVVVKHSLARLIVTRLGARTLLRRDPLLRGVSVGEHAESNGSRIGAQSDGHRRGVKDPRWPLPAPGLAAPPRLRLRLLHSPVDGESLVLRTRGYGWVIRRWGRASSILVIRC
jgi:hypothetical protein